MAFRLSYLKRWGWVTQERKVGGKRVRRHFSGHTDIYSVNNHDNLLHICHVLGVDSPEGGHGNPLQHSCLENAMGRGAWWATARGVTESDMTERLSKEQHKTWFMLCTKNVHKRTLHGAGSVWLLRELRAASFVGRGHCKRIVQWTRSQILPRWKLASDPLVRVALRSKSMRHKGRKVRLCRDRTWTGSLSQHCSELWIITLRAEKETF